MKLNIDRIQNLANTYSDQVRKTWRIDLENIVVVKGDFGWSDTVMEAGCGIISVDTVGDYDFVSGEEPYLVLHEIGHLVGEALNPALDSKSKLSAIKNTVRSIVSFQMLGSGVLSYFRNIYGSMFAHHTLFEGMAECLAFDLFPQACTISNSTRRYIAEQKKAYRECAKTDTLFCFNEIARGYVFFSDKLATTSPESFLSYLKNMSWEDIPSFLTMDSAIVNRQH